MPWNERSRCPGMGGHDRAEHAKWGTGSPRLRRGATVRDDGIVKKSGLRVLGPYKEPHGFRLLVVDGKLRKALKFPSLDLAEQSKRELQREIAERQGRTVSEALTEYEVAMVEERGRLPETAKQACPRLLRFLPGQELLTAITKTRAESIYRAETERLRMDGKPLSVATHHMILNLAKSFFGWCVEKGYLTENPFGIVRKIGRPRTGKEQLTADEARRFLDTAVQRMEQGDHGALAVALQLSLGLRSSEVLLRRVRDVDEAGSVLIIPDGKTHNARRRPHVPEFLRPHLLAAIAGKESASLVFESPNGTQPGFLRGDNARGTFLRRKVHEICKLAGVPIVCPHSLRGLHATLALRQGISSQAVASALGHGSFAITARHYADPGAIVDARVRTVLAALGDPQARTQLSVPELAHSLRSALSPAAIEELVAHLLSPKLE